MFSTAEADMRRERERKDQENKKNQKVEFIVGVQAGIIAGAQKPNIPIPGECRFFRSKLFPGYE